MVSASTVKPPFNVKAKYAWSGESKSDLGFLEGDIMEVTRVTGDWYFGKLLRNRKCTGYFPNNFVTVMEETLRRTASSMDTNIEPSSKMGLPPIPNRSMLKSKPERPHANISSSKSTSNIRNEKFNDYQRHSVEKMTRMKMESYRWNVTARESSKPRRSLDDGIVPSLPPLPTTSAAATRTRHNHPVKSFSSNDLAVSSNYNGSRDDYNFYKHNQMFYDGYMPRSTPSSNTNSNSSAIFSNSKYLDNSLTDSENSFALMSDFSATSAGSFARHKCAQSFADSLERSQNNSMHTKSQTNISSMNGKMGGLLRKIMPKSYKSPAPTSYETEELPKLPELDNLQISKTHNDAKDWLTVKSHLNRSRTLTKFEKHPRYMRVLEENRDIVLHPQDSIYNGLNTNEGQHSGPPKVDIELSELNVEYIDDMTRKRCRKENGLGLDSWAQATFSNRYGTSIEKLRGIYIFCTEMFRLIDDHGSSNFSREPRNLNKVLFQDYCTPYELTWLFKKLANSIGITCEIVIGFLKTPFANNYDFKYNHCWLRVLVKNEWRFIDVILGNTTNPIHEFVSNVKRKRADSSYFLVEPLKFIYTHIPPREFEQHIIPSIDQLSALYLPLVFPSFFRNDLKLHNYSTALSYLEDSEIFECSLELPNDIEVFASVVVPTENQNNSQYNKMELTLTQIKKHKVDSTRRVALIKAVLPPGASKGSLYVHSGLRGTQTTLANVHPVSMLIPLEHKGTTMNYEFVTRVPSENVQKIELYIKEPQSKYLFEGNEYTFEITSSPFDGVMYNRSSKTQNKSQRIAIKSPSGKVHELRKTDPSFPYGASSLDVTITEKGVWTGLVVADSGAGWCPFAEWLCI
ncbi:hypothetical protein KAFR_0A06870 [Kazachstania africana CBS 2517]|uniref:SH3 domain-containing protein n=1 Tax=Kazachstania africana (strain ATCC 22294 / BCRC 22015 / CBS 2517 / CECT 1963 / NBRC 1671 / NRRL Y-8276) TaxID=1071382 RepID=H2AP22_KAZAF|nr:hypothetical protein KAFR_0A06870 [Kazachstania africana CBS 2517]CCF56122.1 hypothetical protein KAFR_0A06870 [Kazachstania africana CBS 2517]